MDIANIGAALGGAARGVDQGLDLYAKYDEMKEANRKRQTERAMEEKVSQLAKTGVFKTDPVAGMKELGGYAAELGRLDLYEQYTKTAEETRKGDAQKTGMMGYVASVNNPQSATEYMNEYFKKMDMPNRVEYVRNNDNSFTVLGMGDDPKVGKRYESAQDFHHDYMLALAPTMLGPEKFMDYETERGLKEAQTENVQAGTGLTRAKTTSEEIAQPYIGRKLESEIGVNVSGAAQNYASAAESRGRASRTAALLPGELQGQAADVLNKQAEAAVAQAIVPERIGVAQTERKTKERLEEEGRTTQPYRYAQQGAETQTAQANAAVATGTVGSRIAGTETEVAKGRREEEEALRTQKDRIEGVSADLAKKRADAARAGTQAAYEAPEAEARIAASKAYAARTATTRAEKTKEAVEGYVMSNPMNPGYVPPRYGDRTNLTLVANAAEGDGLDQSVIAGRAVEALRDTGPKKWDDRNGVVTLANGRQLALGPAAAAVVKSIISGNAPVRSTGAATAGIGSPGSGPSIAGARVGAGIGK